EFLARQHEAERVLAVALAGVPGLSAALAARPRQHVAFNKFLVPGQHVVPGAAGSAMKARLIHAVERDANLTSLQDIGNIAATRGIAHRLLHKRLGASQEPLTVLEALAARVQTPIDDVHDILAFA